MAEGAQGRNFEDQPSTTSHLGDVTAKLNDEALRDLQRPAQQVAPIFFRGQGPREGTPGAGLPPAGFPPAGIGVPGAAFPNGRQADTPPPRRNSFLGGSNNAQQGNGAPLDLQPPVGQPVAQRDWRAHPFLDPVAPAFNRKPVVPPEQQRRGFDAQPTPEPAPAAGSMKAEATRLEPLLEHSLDKGSVLSGNAVLGGVGGVLGGSVVPRTLDSATKYILVNTEPSVAGNLGIGTGLSAWWQRINGLTLDNNEALMPIFKRRNIAEGNISSLSETQLRPEVLRLEKEIDGKTLAKMTDVEKQAIADHLYLNQAQAIEGFHVQPSNAAQQLTERCARAQARLEAEWQAVPEGVRPLVISPDFDWRTHEGLEAELRAYDTQVKEILAKAKDRGELLIEKYERAGEAAFASNPAALEEMRKFKFFTDCRDNPAKMAEYLDNPAKLQADYHISLSEIEKNVARNRELLGKQIGGMTDSVKPILEQYKTAAEDVLKRSGELEELNRYRFFKAVDLDPRKLPGEFQANISASERALINKRVETRDLFEPMDQAAGYRPRVSAVTKEWERATAELKARLQGLEKEIKPLEAKMAEGRKALAEHPTIRKYEWLKNGAQGEMPAGVKMTPDEAANVAKLKAIRERISLLDPWESPLRVTLRTDRENLAKAMKKVSDQMVKDQTDIIARGETRATISRPTWKGFLTEQVPVERVLSPEDLKIWQKYEYFKTGGKTQLPPPGLLSASEADIVLQAERIGKQVAGLEVRDARAASGFRARIAANGEKLAEGHWGNFWKGVAAVTAADYFADRLDNMSFSQSHRTGTHYLSWMGPWLGLMTPGGWKTKTLSTIGLTVGGRWLENTMPLNPKSQWNDWLRPTGWDGLALGIASTIPMRNGSIPWRLAYMGIGLGISKGATHLLEGPSARQIRDEGWGLLAKDKTERCATSMNNSIDQIKKLDDYPLKGDAKKYMTVLEYYLADWLGRDHSKPLKSGEVDLLNGDRGAAIFLAAAGETRLANGTKVANGEGSSSSPWYGQLWTAVKASAIGRDRQFDYIVAGKDYDLGGQALKYLAGAREEINRAKEQTTAKMEQTVRGTKVTQKEIADLNQVGQRIDTSLQKVYGKHDIPALLKEVQEYTINLNQKTMGKVRDQIKVTIANPNTDDKRFIAKFYRDLALIDLAWAANKIGANGVGKGKDGESAAIMLGEAKLALQKAKELDPDPNKEDPNKADWGQLDKIEKDLEKKVPYAIQAQWASNVFNGLNIPRDPNAPGAPNRPAFPPSSPGSPNQPARPGVPAPAPIVPRPVVPGATTGRSFFGPK